MEAADVQVMQPYTFNAAPMGTFGEPLGMLVHSIADFQREILLHRNRILQQLLSQRNIPMRTPSPPVVSCMPRAATPGCALDIPLVTDLFEPVSHSQHPPPLNDAVSLTDVMDMWAILKDPKDVIDSGTEETCDARTSSDDEVASRHNDAPQSSTKRRALVTPRWSITREQRQLLDELFKVEPVPSRAMAENIAEQFGVSTQQIKVWFRNQRQKVRLGQRSAS